MTPALGGAMLAALGGTAVVAGLRRRGPVGLVVAAAGGALAYRGLTGSSLADRLVDRRTIRQPRLAIGPRAWSLDDDGTLVVRRSITIARTSDAVDVILADPASLAVLSPSIDASDVAAGGSLRWRVGLPGGRALDVTAERLEHRPGETVGWRIETGLLAGTLIRLDEHERVADGSTELDGSIRVPASAARPIPRRFLAAGLGTELQEVLRRMRSLAEGGELATTDGQPAGAGRASPIGARAAFASEVAGLPDRAVIGVGDREAAR
jgi:uncharacterized membrane protein